MMPDIGLTIKRLRKEAKLSQEKLAERLGVTNQAVSKWESGQALPDITLILPLANLFGVTTDSLLGNTSADDSGEIWTIHSDGYVETALERRLEIFRSSLKRMPQNGQLLADAINTGFQLAKSCLDGNDPRAGTYFNETVSLCEQQLEYSHDPNEINYARFILAVLYASFGDSSQADALAAQFPAYDAVVASGAVKAAVRQASGDTAEEIEARVDNLLQILLSITNEVYALNNACKKLLTSSGNIDNTDRNRLEDDHMNTNPPLVWTTEFTKLDCRNRNNLALRGSVLYYISRTTEKQKLCRYDLSSGTSAEFYAQDGNAMLSLCVAPDGTLIVFNTLWHTETQTNTYTLSRLNLTDAPDATIISTVMIPDTEGGLLSIGMQGIVADADGNVYRHYIEKIVVYNINGTKVRSFDRPRNGAHYMVQLSDGRVAVLQMVYQAPKVPPIYYTITPIDLKAGAWGEPIALPSCKGQPFGGRGKYLFFYIDSTDRLIGYNIETRAHEPLFSCIELNINTNQVEAFSATEDGVYRIGSVIASSSGSYIELATVTQKPEVAPVRHVIEYAALSLDYLVRQQIAAFNRTNPDYKIHVTEYGTDSEARQNFMKALLSGKGQDIVDLSNMPVKQLEYKGLFENLYTYIDSDPELSRDSFMSAPLKAMETDGGLYTVSPEFSVSTLACLPQVLGGGANMTLDDLRALLDAHPHTAAVSQWWNVFALEMLLTHCIDDFIDWKTGKCGFESDDFITLLEICNRFPERPEGPLMMGIPSGDTLLEDLDIHFAFEMQYYKKAMGGVPVFVHYPSRSGNGNRLTSSRVFAMTASSEQKDIAWHFIRALLLGELFTLGFPLLKSKFDERIKKELTEDYKTEYSEDGQVKRDENSKPVYILDENGERIITPKQGRNLTIRLNEPPQPVDMFWMTAASREDCDQVMALINSTSQVLQRDPSLLEIIRAKAEPFFKGERTANETAAAIQSKVSAYINA